MSFSYTSFRQESYLAHIWTRSRGVRDGATGGAKRQLKASLNMVGVYLVGPGGGGKTTLVNVLLGGEHQLLQSGRRKSLFVGFGKIAEVAR